MAGLEAPPQVIEADARRLDARVLLPVTSGLAIALIAPLLGLASEWQPVAIALILLAGLAAGSQQDSIVTLASTVVTVIVWLALGPSGTSWATPIAALLLLVGHTAAAMAASIPPRGRLDAFDRRRWLIRAGSVAAITLGVYALLRLVRDASLHGSIAVLVLSLLVFSALMILVRAETLSGDPEPAGATSGWHAADGGVPAERAESADR